MGLDDFAPTGIKTVAKRALAPEDEDLFDFPVIEMIYEGDKASERHAIASVGTAPAPSAPAPASIAPAAPAKAAPKSESAQAPSPKSAPTKSAPAKSASSKSAQSAPKSGAKAAAASAHGDVQPAADLIDQLEEALDDRRSLERGPRRRTSGARFALPLGAPRVLLGGMLMLNVLTFAFFWMVSQSFRSGIESLRDDLLLATRNAPLVSVQAAPVTHEPAPVEPVATKTHTEPAHVTPPAPANPLDAFEQTTLALAAKEIGAGEFMTARKRLNRLLALADRIDATLKADIEARARFLIAESYRAQGLAKEAHLEEVVHANEAAARTSAPAQVPAKTGGH